VDIVTRVKNILTHPTQEWPVVAAEPGTPAGIVAGYVAPLAAIAPLASFIGLCVVGIGVPFIGTYRVGFANGLAQSAMSFVLALVGVFVLAAIVDALAPSFAGRKSGLAALKVTAYSFTPAFVAGILLVFPPFGMFAILAGLYGIYLLYTGLPIIMGTPREKAPIYTLAVVGSAIVVGMVLAVVSFVGHVGYSYAVTGSPFGIEQNASNDEARNVAASIVGNAVGGGDKNQQAAQQLVDSVASAAADETTAEQKGDANGQAQAGINILKSIVTGGKNVTVVPREQLAALLPDNIGDMTRGVPESDTGEFAGIKGSKASALYKGGSGSIELEVGDMGNAGGLALLAGAAANLTEHENDQGYEKNVDVGGMKVHEEWTNAGKHSELFAIVDNRWALGATGDGLEMDDAVKALQTIDVSKLQAFETGK
jgi:hypothetical protein